MLKTYLRVAVTAACYAVLLWRIDVRMLLHALSQVAYLPLLLALLLYVGGQALCAWRWQLLAAPIGLVMKYSAALSAYFVGMFFNQFLPTIIGGDVVRIMTVSRRGEPSSRAAASVFMERNAGFVAMLGIAAVAAWAARQPLGGLNVFLLFGLAFLIHAAVNLLILSGTGAWVAKWCERVPVAGGWLRDGVGSVTEYRSQVPLLMFALVLSIVYQLSVVTKHYLYSRAIGVEIPFACFLVFVPTISLAGMLPVSMNGMGVREATMVALYTTVGATKEQALSMALLHAVLIVVCSSPGGLVHLFGRRLPAVRQVASSGEV